MKTAIIFTRHDLTEKQIHELIEVHGMRKIITMKETAELDLNTDNDVDMAGFAIRCQIMNNLEMELIGIFGVFPPPLMNWLKRLEPEIPLYSAWNIKRTREGCPATFEHKQWIRIN